MRMLMNRVRKYATAGLVSIGLTSPVLAQPAPSAAAGPPPATLPPTAPTNSFSYTALPPVAPSALPGVGGNPLPGGAFQTQPVPMPPNTVPGQALAQDPLLSSRPGPLQVPPNAPATSNDSNFYAGNKPVQDLTSLMSGKFSDTKYKWYGFVRVDGIYDFRPMSSTDSFVTSAIPVPQGRGQNAVLTPRYTRFGFDTETPIKSLDWTMKTRIEVDFFNGNTSGNFGSFPLRLRFAWADFGPFLVGQEASLFMDYDVFPNVLDYQGPGGMVLVRQPVLALHHKFGDNVKVMVGIEQPYSDISWLEGDSWRGAPGSGIISTPGVARNVQDVPDFTANVKYTGDYGHMQVAGILRKLTYQPATGDSALDELGYGINVTGTLHPWAGLTGTPKSGDDATIWSRSRFLGAFAAGRGITRYYNDTNGLGLDATFDPVNGFRALPSIGWFVGYEQWWCKTVASVFTYGENQIELTGTQPGSTYNRANYISANLIWLPVERFGVGVEGLYGYRKNKDGEKGENTRIQMAVQYRF